MPRAFQVRLAGVAPIGAGFADFPLIAYHCFRAAHAVAAPWIPALHAPTMGTDAVAALALGVPFDSIGAGAMVLATPPSAAAAPPALLGGISAVVIGMARCRRTAAWARRSRSCGR